ncbi:phosphotransferase enzyme family protein [Streptomyces sp. BR1]|uniref:phosphotransferase enzyme family protein n=1 Tax=Streptomyces sp. BR1 TaxID=1592323 RepID=UPI00402B5F2D
MSRKGSRPVPLTHGGEAPLSHTAGLWRTTYGGRDHVFKVQLNLDAVRDARFHPLKQQILQRCLRAGVPVPLAVPTRAGEPMARRNGHVCELIPLVAGTGSAHSTSAQAQAVITTGLALRSVLDALPRELVLGMATIPLPALVDEPDWRFALDDDVDRLLPVARARGDSWGRIARDALEGLALARPLLARARTELMAVPASRLRIIHGDLHHHHFLFGADGRPDVVAVLDFDNLTVGDRLLDLAWVAETSGRVRGGARALRTTMDSFLSQAVDRGLLARGEARLLMPLLIAQAVPVVVDIAKDILERDLLSPAWTGYLELLDTRRRLALHQLLSTAASDETDLPRPRTEHDR